MTDLEQIPELGPMLGDGDSDFVSAFARGLAVIQAFDSRRPALSVSEVAEITGVTRASARRLLYTLCALGFARQEGRTYVLTPQLLRLGSAYLSSTRLSAIARPHLRSLVANLNEFASMSVLDGDEVVYIARELADRLVMVGINVGTRFPAYATATGRVMLAALPETEIRQRLARVKIERHTEHSITEPAALLTEILAVRDQGYSWVDEELGEGVRSLAVPVRGRDDDVIAAVNVSGGNVAASEAFRSRALPLLIETAAAIEADYLTIVEVVDPLD